MMLKRKRGRPKVEPHANSGVSLPVRQWVWLRCQPEPVRVLLRNLIEAEMLRRRKD